MPPYAATALMTAKFRTMASERLPALALETVISHEPAPTAVTESRYAALVPTLPTFTITTSVAAITLLVSVKATSTPALSAALFIVICPQTLLSVTPVLLFVCWVTAPPAPVVYPMPAVALLERKPAMADSAPSTRSVPLIHTLLVIVRRSAIGRSFHKSVLVP